MITSKTCTYSDYETDFYAPIANRMGQGLIYHRKQWEYVMITQALLERGCLQVGQRGLGFAVGTEPLAALFASHGCMITATDQHATNRFAHDWGLAQMLAESRESIRKPDLCPDDQFDTLVEFFPVDMNDIPTSLYGQYDFLWSACSFEHIGSLEKGMTFVLKAMECLKPGGWAVHTTEYNASSNEDTVETPDLSLFRRKDMEELIRRLEAVGHRVVPIDFAYGDHEYDHIIAQPPYDSGIHLKLSVHGFEVTSLLLIIQKGTQSASRTTPSSPPDAIYNMVGPLRQLRQPLDDLIIRLAYRTLLHRPPDDAGFFAYRSALQQHKMTYRQLLWSFLQSQEFVERHLVPVTLLRAFPQLLKQHLLAMSKEGLIPSNRSFIQAAYRVLLQREADEGGLNQYLQALEQGRMSKLDVLRSLITSNEYQVLLLGGRPIEVLHEVRMQLIRNHIPPATTIVDLGGGAIMHPQGALLAMGYPYHPNEVFIVDLPPEERFTRTAGTETVSQFVTEHGSQIHYFYRSMTDLGFLADASVDMVMSGESIEHITEADAHIVCREVYRVLKPGGYFCLDTPNARLTRLQSPTAMIHPEHKKEYLVHELRALLEQWGFEIVEAIGICPMAQSIRTQVFQYREIIENPFLTEQAEDGYLFFLKARKPQSST